MVEAVTALVRPERKQVWTDGACAWLRLTMKGARPMTELCAPPGENPCLGQRE